MKQPAFMLVGAALLLAGSAPVVAHELKGHNANEVAALGFLDTAFNKREPARAFAKYGGPYYRQHNPMVADGRDAAIASFNAFLPKFPAFHYDFKRVISSGNYVVVHSRVTTSAEDRGAAVVDIFRLSHGKIVEHWDVNQPVPETSANNNTMF